jgi:alcohol dehydrogenase
MTLPDGFQFHSPTRVLYGCGLVRELAAEVERFGERRVLLVTEKLLRRIGVATKVESALQRGPARIVAVFDEVVPNSELAVVRRGIDLARQHRVDMVIAAGGGSTMDTAKAINMVVRHGGDPMDYQGAQVLSGPCHPLVAIPTTAGTGSEVSNVAAIHDAEANHKVLFVDHWLMPDLAVLDPELTLSVPPRVTAATGMDALTHAVESYVSVQAFPFADALALRAAELISAWIIPAVRDGSNLAARGHMLAAACMAGMAFTQAGVGCVHGMSHALGGMFGVTHGEANSILLPVGMEHNLASCPDRFAELARVLGARETRGMDPVDAGRKGIECVRQLQVLLKEHAGLPSRLAEVGVPEARLAEVAAAALLDGAMIYNRHPVDEPDALAMLGRAY